MTHFLTRCTQCGEEVTVITALHPCDNKPYILTVEGRCPSTKSYHNIMECWVA